MAITIGGGFNSYRAMANMKKTSALMNKSLERISSGLRINSASDDAGGLAVGMKLSNEVNIAAAERQNVENAKSFVDSQSSALQSAADIVGQMKTLKTQYDSAVAGSDVTAYESEFQELRSQLGNLMGQSYNGNALFTATADVNNADDPIVAGVKLEDFDLESALQTSGAVATGLGTRQSSINLADPNSTPAVSLDDAFLSDELDQIENNVLSELGKSAANSSALSFASSYLESKEANLEAARSRVMDADIVEESTNLSLYKIQYEASVAALAQANSTQQTVMELLLFPNNN